jgi:Uma2 family endonuclease
MTDLLARTETMTVEQFYDYCIGRDGRIELVDGKVIEMPPVANDHGEVDSNLHGILGPFVRRRRLGKVYLNTGFILRREPPLVYAPDEAFITAERLAAHPPAPKRGYWEMVPDLAVEIVSPDDRPGQLRRKIDEYLAFGVRCVWVVYPIQREVRVFRPGTPVEVLAGDAVLEGEELLPGFSVALTELWTRE